MKHFIAFCRTVIHGLGLIFWPIVWAWNKIKPIALYPLPDYLRWSYATVFFLVSVPSFFAAYFHAQADMEVAMGHDLGIGLIWIFNAMLWVNGIRDRERKEKWNTEYDRLMDEIKEIAERARLYEQDLTNAAKGEIPVVRPSEEKVH